MNEKQLILDYDKLGADVMHYALQLLKGKRDLKHLSKEKFIELTTLKIIEYLELLKDIDIIDSDMFLSIIIKSFIVINENYIDIIEYLYVN